MKKLTHLDLAETRVGDAGLVHLKSLDNLQTLDLTGTQVTPAGLEHLRAFNSLRFCDFSYTAVPPELAADFNRRLQQRSQPADAASSPLDQSPSTSAPD